jgi:two-component system response regulator FixJ
MTPTVYVVDDDEAVRDALAQLLAQAGLPTRTFAEGEAFLAAVDAHARGCVILDFAMPGMSGAEVQAALARRGASLPVLFLTAHADVPLAVRVLKAGAEDLLQTPFEAKALLSRVREAVSLDAQRNRAALEAEAVRERFLSLTPREREVLALAAVGHTNKTAGRLLGISHRTVEVHRSRAMLKMGIRSQVELGAIAGVCGIGPAPAPKTGG